MDNCLKSPFPCYFFVYRCRFAFMVAFVPNRIDLPFYSQSVCIKPASCLICLICFASLHPFSQSSVVVCDLQIVFFESLVCFQNPMCDFIGFEMCLLQSFVNRESSYDVKKGIRCDDLVRFLHLLRKSDVWLDNAYFISS